MTSRSRLPLLAAATAATLALAGCAGASAAPSDSSDETSLTWGWALPTSWDPVTSTAGWDTHALALVYDGLTQLDTEGEVVPGLAESWEYNEDGTAITFHLREGAEFTDGTPVTADAVKQSIERGRDQENSTLAGQLRIVVGIDVDDEQTVTVHLDQADYQVPYLFAGKTGFIVNPAAFDDVTTLATQPEGSGPFALTEYVPNAHADLEKNEDYWNADHIFIDDFSIVPVTDPATVVAGVSSGQWDVAQVPPAQVEGAEAANLEVETIRALTVRALDVNSTVAPFDDQRVLQAISHATDRQALVDAAYFGQGTPNWQPFPEGYVAHSPELDELYPHDVEAAKELLAEAGHPDGLEITLSLTEDDTALAEVLQAQWAEAGIDVTLNVLPSAAVAQNYVQRTLPFVLDSYSGRQSPLQGLEVLYGTEGLMNLGRQTPPELTAAIDAARATPTDADDYAEKVQDAVEIGVELQPNTFLFSWPRILVHPEKVTGIQHWLDVQRWEDVKVEG
ncbi:ABC transporter substrate-binding protein [Microbacterium hydrocarbonoxydans]|uniref:Peptide/nickel transport system substrate-binding protein n=1 Tax=Microbacterium hydrocarbonoxydans TaxID=273678 RepID=A0A1H4K9L4_9MICO|nr:ABC transporter substrate-binding protein [Microbacterium hydrocarbonoxydans]SEB55097.1 peptide/nickel transport system substrate-binding protein [Microbacterium hydrocarbonoxydans]